MLSLSIQSRIYAGQFWSFTPSESLSAAAQDLFRGGGLRELGGNVSPKGYETASVFLQDAKGFFCQLAIMNVGVRSVPSNDFSPLVSDGHGTE